MVNRLDRRHAVHINGKGVLECWHDGPMHQRRCDGVICDKGHGVAVGPPERQREPVFLVATPAAGGVLAGDDAESWHRQAGIGACSRKASICATSANTRSVFSARADMNIPSANVATSSLIP
jgi:hypothetical protein